MADQTQLMVREVKYEVAGEEVKLSGDIVCNYLKRGNGNLTNQEIVMFINLCKFQKLNPFLNEAYIVKFGSDAQIVVGKEAFMKRAESQVQYDGFEAGIIVERNGEVKELAGCFALKNDTLLGGWCRVYRKDRSHPIYQSVSFSEYNKSQSTWKSMPATMIRKVAIVQALREAFPIDLGAMYTTEEIIDTTGSTPQDNVDRNANKQDFTIDTTVTDVQEQQPSNVEQPVVLNGAAEGQMTGQMSFETPTQTTKRAPF